jgi:hypothetical protein
MGITVVINDTSFRMLAREILLTNTADFDGYTGITLAGEAYGYSVAGYAGMSYVPGIRPASTQIADRTAAEVYQVQASKTLYSYTSKAAPGAVTGAAAEVASVYNANSSSGHDWYSQSISGGAQAQDILSKVGVNYVNAPG